MKIAYTCFITGALAALAGMSLGIWMGMHENFTLAPVHAHVNLLGWVTLGLYGLYHRGVRRDDNRLAWAQVGAAIAGVPLLAVGLAIYLSTGSQAAGPLIGVGSILSLGGMVLFLIVLISDSRRVTRPVASAAASVA